MIGRFVWKRDRPDIVFDTDTLLSIRLYAILTYKTREFLTLVRNFLVFISIVYSKQQWPFLQVKTEVLCKGDVDTELNFFRPIGATGNDQAINPIFVIRTGF